MPGWPHARRPGPEPGEGRPRDPRPGPFGWPGGRCPGRRCNWRCSSPGSTRRPSSSGSMASPATSLRLSAVSGHPFHHLSRLRAFPLEEDAGRVAIRTASFGAGRRCDFVEATEDEVGELRGPWAHSYSFAVVRPRNHQRCSPTSSRSSPATSMGPRTPSASSRWSPMATPSGRCDRTAREGRASALPVAVHAEDDETPWPTPLADQLYSAYADWLPLASPYRPLLSNTPQP